MKPLIIVHDIYFSSKQFLEQYCRGIIQGYHDGEMMRDNDRSFFLSLIATRHHAPEQKIIPGKENDIVGIRVRHDSPYGSTLIFQNQIFVVYRDGEEIDVSWRKCCSGFSPKSSLNSAMRRAVVDDTHGFKLARFATPPVHCEATGVLLEWKDAQVDHFPITFASLRDNFLLLDSGSVNYEAVPLSHDPRGGVIMRDEIQRTRWRQYHRAFSTLRIVTIEENRKSWRHKDAI
jgi:hypothetical protein